MKSGEYEKKKKKKKEEEESIRFLNCPAQRKNSHFAERSENPTLLKANPKSVQSEKRDNIGMIKYCDQVLNINFILFYLSIRAYTQFLLVQQIFFAPGIKTYLLPLSFSNRLPSLHLATSSVDERATVINQEGNGKQCRSI